MLELTVNLDERSYPIYIGESVLQDNGRLVHHVGDCRPIIITNDTIAPLYLQGLLDSLDELNPLFFIIPDGEQFKSLEWFEKISAFLLQNNCGRDTCLIALGGGVVGDLTGFVAACYQRGVPFIQIPTTLLSQVDSSVGGKTAVNHPLGKNMIGAFYQPQAVFIDTQSLHTLPAREFAAGMAEVIKYGLIYDTELFSYLENNVENLQQLNEVSLQHIIFRCCEIKALIVAQDEKEQGLRALLNLGHTFAHAIEAQMGYGTWLHGEAVAIGMVLAAKLAHTRKDLSTTEVARIVDVIAQYNLPTKIPSVMTSEQFLTHMRKDKKNKKGTIRFILPTQFGQCALVDDVSDDQVRALIEQ
ncbi:3-dehydroquinate synthase [Pseudoalteromonas sp. BSi20652]|uniref:3-dehydroquinate synthase n=1 Tax=Pseudoalteromonas sp. BSi20652 TaxID=388384 RepID=UPI0002316AB9|nr:3-dehydroquinate synthase [Pseudoalteromonas sp. BSi20652]GAA59760.1 3-dehydroquinate synthase [Pseudoalteromonas sp. BSi20652]